MRAQERPFSPTRPSVGRKMRRFFDFYNTLNISDLHKRRFFRFSNMGHFTLQYGSFCSAKWAVLRHKMVNLAAQNEAFCAGGAFFLPDVPARSASKRAFFTFFWRRFSRFWNVKILSKIFTFLPDKGTCICQQKDAFLATKGCMLSNKRVRS